MIKHTVPPICFTRRSRDQAKVGDFTIKDQKTIANARAFLIVLPGPVCHILSAEKGTGSSMFRQPKKTTSGALTAVLLGFK